METKLVYIAIDRQFLIKATGVLLVIVSIYGGYKWGYKIGARDAFEFMESYLKEQVSGSSDIGPRMKLQADGALQDKTNA